MATWQDGAAYAPIERPDGFATPVAEPLPAAEPYHAATAGAVLRPEGFDSPALRPLSELTVSPLTSRDPREGFDVASLTMTAGSARTTGRDPKTPFSAGVAIPAVDSIQAPPTGRPLAIEAPTPPVGAGPWHGAQPSAPPATPARYPTPTWAPPTPGGPPPHQAATPAATSSQRSLGWVCMGLSFAGLLLSGAAPFLLLVAGALGLRTRSVTTWVGPATLGVGLFSLLVQLGIGELGTPNVLLGVLSFLCCIGFLVTSLRSGQSL